VTDDNKRKAWGEDAFMGDPPKQKLEHWANILFELRQKSGLSRVQLAEESGVGVSTIENYERKKISEPSIYKIELLLQAMGYELDAIFVKH
jgi:transcriptional regulator with XRE-family HTH domain|tara:strand:+ start:1629 stop:1901 length:273 start_codon:yes stop_codon:yes gene_type:complete